MTVDKRCADHRLVAVGKEGSIGEEPCEAACRRSQHVARLLALLRAVAAVTGERLGHPEESPLRPEEDEEDHVLGVEDRLREGGAEGGGTANDGTIDVDGEADEHLPQRMGGIVARGGRAESFLLPIPEEKKVSGHADDIGRSRADRL